MILFIQIQSDIGAGAPPWVLTCQSATQLIQTLIFAPISFIILAWSYGELQRAPPPPLGRSSCSSGMLHLSDQKCRTRDCLTFWLLSGSTGSVLLPRFPRWIHTRVLAAPHSGVHLAPAHLMAVGHQVAVASAGVQADLDRSQQVETTALCQPVRWRHAGPTLACRPNGCW